MSYELNTERLRQIYTLSATSGLPVLSRSTDEEKATAGRTFDSWLARVKREAAAEALVEAADEARRIESGTPWVNSGAEIVHCDTVREDPSEWLHRRAAEIREGQTE